MTKNMPNLYDTYNWAHHIINNKYSIHTLIMNFATSTSSEISVTENPYSHGNERQMFPICFARDISKPSWWQYSSRCKILVLSFWISKQMLWSTRRVCATPTLGRTSCHLCLGKCRSPDGSLCCNHSYQSHLGSLG